jgi:hypothetical protein
VVDPCSGFKKSVNVRTCSGYGKVKMFEHCCSCSKHVRVGSNTSWSMVGLGPKKMSNIIEACMGNAMKTLAQHMHRCALDRPGCVSISGVRTSLCIGLANPRSKVILRCPQCNVLNTAMGLIAISFFLSAWGKQNRGNYRALHPSG